MSMLKYTIRRILAMIPVIFGVLTLTFILSRMMPEDPVIQLLAAQGQHSASPELIAQVRHNLGLDLPIILQYFRYIGELFTGNWGVSVSYARNEPVWELIATRLPITIDLTIFSVIIASFIGVKVGVTAATHRNKLRDTVMRGVSLVGVAFPVFFLGMLLQYFFTTNGQIEIFPGTGYKNAIYEDPPFVTGFLIIDSILAGQFYFTIDYLTHIILPVFCLSFISIAGITRQTRSSMLEVLQQDYIRTARAKGCKEKDVVNKHALRNALIPTVTIIGFNVAGLLAGAVLTETTFGLDGIGTLYVDAISLADYWLLNAIVFVITVIFISTTLITDLIYALLDPRIVY
jgi:ABC-type dipeptide/oligopeptide/nickel transport system permease component